MVPSATITFRLSRESDLPQIQQFANTLYSEDENIAELRPDMALTHTHLAAHPDKGQLVVLESDGTICGYAIIIFFWSNEYRNDLIEIDELFISPDFRGQRIGTTFFAWLKHNFRSAGLTLQVATKNPKAKQLYENLGFKTSRNEHMIWIFDQ